MPDEKKVSAKIFSTGFFDDLLFERRKSHQKKILFLNKAQHCIGIVFIFSLIGLFVFYCKMKER
jgi:hypothetical protein